MDTLPQKQLSLADVYSDCQIIFETDQHRLLSLLERNLNLDILIPDSFYRHYYSPIRRPREFKLHSMIRALLLQKIFSIPSDTLQLIFLIFSREIRDFCGFKLIPDASRSTRFKQAFLLDLQSFFFDHLVDVTEPICQAIDPQKTAMSIFDTSGIETYVTENNPKYFDHIMIQLKAFKKANQLPDSYDPYKASYKMMPPMQQPIPPSSNSTSMAISDMFICLA